MKTILSLYSSISRSQFLRSNTTQSLSQTTSTPLSRPSLSYSEIISIRVVFPVALSPLRIVIFRWIVKEYLIRLFLTVISKFSRVGVFSVLNNLLDISLSGQYGDITGYTQEELESNFVEWIGLTASKMGISRSEILERADPSSFLFQSGYLTIEKKHGRITNSWLSQSWSSWFYCEHVLKTCL